MYHLLHIGCLIALLLPLCTYAEEHPPKSSKKIDHLLQKLLPPSRMDSTYAMRDSFRFILKPKITVSFGEYSFRQEESDKDETFSLQSDPIVKIGINFTYRNLTLSLQTSTDKITGRANGEEVEYGIQSHGNRLGGELLYSTSANYTLHDAHNRELLPDLRCFKSQRLHAAGYYVFNHRRFAYPCTITQSYYQKQSCGSLIASLTAGHRILDMDQNRIPENSDLAGLLSIIPREIRYTHAALGIGYAYNWIPHPRWTLHGSLQASIPLYEHGKITTAENHESIKWKPYNLDYHVRIGALWSHRRYFSGLYVLFNAHRIQFKAIDISDLYFRSRIYFGMRF